MNEIHSYWINKFLEKGIDRGFDSRSEVVFPILPTRRFDVVWFKDDKPIYAFEFEYHSGKDQILTNGKKLFFLNKQYGTKCYQIDVYDKMKSTLILEIINPKYFRVHPIEDIPRLARNFGEWFIDYRTSETRKEMPNLSTEEAIERTKEMLNDLLLKMIVSEGEFEHMKKNPHTQRLLKAMEIKKELDKKREIKEIWQIYDWLEREENKKPQDLKYVG